MADTAAPQTAQCQVCSGPTGDQGNLCRTHSGQLISELDTVPDLVADLEITTTRQARINAEKHGGRSATAPLPWNEHSAARAFELNSTINAWALDTAKLGEDERDPLKDIPYVDTAAVSSWLRRNVSTLRQHAEAGTAWDELTNAITEARRAVDKPPEQVTYGPCGNTGTPEEPHEPCREYLYALPGKPLVTCRACGAKYDTGARLEWMREYARDMLATATEAAGYLRLTGVKTSPEAVRALADRERIIAVALDSRGRPLYRISDVVLAISERYKRRKSAAPAA